MAKARGERWLAQQAGRARYYTGHPCKHGHISERKTVNSACVACDRLNKKAYRLSNIESARAREKEKRERNPDAYRAAKQKWAASLTVEKIAVLRDRYRSSHRAAYKADPKKFYAYMKAAKLLRAKRMPPWVNRKPIAGFYKGCPPGHHVDHIVPLCGKNVSGLHVLANLQYLPAADNIRKGNKYDDQDRPGCAI